MAPRSPTPSGEFYVVPMTAAHLDFAAGLARAENWFAQTRAAFEDLLDYNPAGCFVALCDGEPAGMCVAVAYRRFGFIGELIVRPDLRGGGIGTHLFLTAVDYLKNNSVQVIALDGDPPGVPIYERAGFVRRAGSLRFNGRLVLSPAEDGYSPVRLATQHDLEPIYEIDRRIFGDDRSFFLRRRYERHPELCFVAEMKGELAGYIFGLKEDDLLIAGPWAARPTLPEPWALLECLYHAAGEPRLHVGVLEGNRRAVSWLRAQPGLKEDGSSIRMTYAPSPKELPDDGPGAHPDLYAIYSGAIG